MHLSILDHQLLPKYLSIYQSQLNPGLFNIPEKQIKHLYKFQLAPAKSWCIINSDNLMVHTHYHTQAHNTLLNEN